MIEVSGRFFYVLQLKVKVPTRLEAFLLWAMMCVSNAAPIAIGVYALGQWLGGQL